MVIKHSSAWNMHMLTHKGATVTDPLHIGNIFSNYFSSVAEKTKANLKFSNFNIFFIILMKSRYS